MNGVEGLMVDPALRSSLRHKVLRYAVPRAAARAMTHAKPSFWRFVSGAHAGEVVLQIEGHDFRYALGPGDPIGDLLYWCGGQAWGSGLVDVFLKHVASASRMLDIGANCGVLSLLACAANPTIQVIAWEPVHWLAQRIQMSVRLNAFEDRIRVRESAVGSRAGFATLYLHDDPTMNSLSQSAGASAGSIEVPIEAVDDQVHEPVNLVKIDVENHEVDVLHGMQSIIARYRPTIIFESGNEELYRNCCSLLAGYKVLALTRDGQVEGYRADALNYLALP